MSTFDGAAAWERFAIVHLFMTFEAVTLMSLAFMFSCFNMKPAAATILAQLGRTAEARTALARALNIRPDYPDAISLSRQLPQ